MLIVQRRRVSVYDPDAQAYITAVEAADTQALEVGVKDAINAFVVGCKADGVWSAIKASCIMAGARTLAGALTPVVGAAPTRLGTEGGWNYNRKTGTAGNGTNNYLNTGRNNNADPQNSQHLSVFPTTVNTLTTERIYIGAGFLDGGSTYFATRAADAFSRNRSGSGDTGLTRGPAGALIAVSRASSSSYIYRQGGSSATIARASNTPFNGNIFVYQSNGFAALSDARLAFYSIGESLDLALLDARVTALINAIAAAIP
jgi:hypothetical protein